jgi:hypothetical protein
MTKLDANMDAVILRQSVQLHTNVSTRPGAVTGCGTLAALLVEGEAGEEETNECELHGAAETGCGRFVVSGPPVAGEACEGHVGL